MSHSEPCSENIVYYEHNIKLSIRGNFQVTIWIKWETEVVIF